VLLERDANLRLLIQGQSWLRLVDPVKGPARQIRQGKCHKALALRLGQAHCRPLRLPLPVPLLREGSQRFLRVVLHCERGKVRLMAGLGTRQSKRCTANGCAIRSAPNTCRARFSSERCSTPRVRAAFPFGVRQVWLCRGFTSFHPPRYTRLSYMPLRFT
jgi:hypothetical protein